MFSKKSIGLNISDKTIELVSLKKKSNSFVVDGVARVEFEDGVVERGQIADEDKLIKILKNLFDNTSPNKASFSDDVIFSIPDAISYTYVFEIEKYSPKKTSEIVREEIIKNIPEEINNLVYRFQVLKIHEGTAEALVMLAKKDAMLSWQSFFNKHKINIEVYDFENLANLRAIFEEKPTKPFCLVDIGYKETSINIFGGESIELSTVSVIAGDEFTQVISKVLGVESYEAESLKVDKGLGVESREAVLALTGEIDKIISEIRQAINYFEIKNNQKVEEIVLLGGSAKMIGLVEYFEKKLKLKAALANCFINLNKGKLEYLTSLGLARRGVDSEYDKKDLKISQIDPSLKSEINLKNILPNENQKIKVIQEGDINKSAFKEVQPKAKNHIGLLVGILIFCSLVFVGILFFKANQKDENNNSEIYQGYKINQKIELSLPIAIQAREYTVDRLRGQVINIDTEANDISQAEELTFAKLALENSAPNYTYTSPLNIIELTREEETNQNNNPREYRVSWLVFNRDQAKQAFIEDLRNKSGEQRFIFNSIEYIDLVSTSNSAVYILEASLDINSDNFLEL